MKEVFKVLIADRNRNIREFLQRELMTEGYKVLLACDARQVVKILEIEAPDLLILDLDIPYLDEFKLFDKLQEGKFSTPLLIHTLLTDYATHPAIKKAAGFVEKDGQTITNLKTMVSDVLRKYYPQRV